MQQDFEMLIVCHHEAGHAVVGHALGWQLRWVAAGRGRNTAAFEPVRVKAPSQADTKRERNRCVAAQRRAMTILSAGPVAATIHQKAAEARGWRCREERRAYRKGWEYRVSVVPLNRNDDPDSDYHLVREAARKVVGHEPHPFFLATRDTQAERDRIQRDFLRDWGEDIRAEILRAEARAEAILKRHWGVVADIAAALHRSKSGRLLRRHLLPRLESVPVAAKK